MEHLNRIIQGIVIGNGEVFNFLDYAVNRNCGSLITYTQKNNYLKANLFNNFDNGDNRRYYKGHDIIDTGNYGLSNMGNYLIKNGINANGGMIGELYSASESNNSELKFMTEYRFTKLNENIRDLILNKNLLDYEKRIDDSKTISVTSYMSDMSDVINDTEMIAPKNHNDMKGEEYTVLSYDNVKDKLSLDEVGEFARLFNKNLKLSIKEKLQSDSGLDNEQTYKDIHVSPKFPIYNGLIGEKIKDRIGTLKPKLSIDKVAESIRNSKFSDEFTPLNSLIRQNPFLLSVVKNNKPYLGGFNEERTTIDELLLPYLNIQNDLFSEGIDTTKLNKLVIRTEEGLKEYYSALREKYVNPVEDLKYSRKGFWSALKSYGVDYSNTGVEYYTNNEYDTSDKKRLENNTSISPSFIGGSHRVIVNNNISYSYYQEPNGEDLNPSLNVGDGVYNGTSVILSDYNGTSRLLQRTNELFKQAKINTLINRFHTNVRDVDSELITSYDKNFGISRGRNLIQKRYEGGQIGDNETGYDNPYCRVWTAHRQYSKLRDRIRPFAKEDGNPLTISETQEKYGALRPNNGGLRLNQYSVLGDNGYVNISSSYNVDGNFNDVKRYMFSIENLAWKDVGNNALSEEQQGPNKGRIMWFPPYNLKFSENINVNWNANSFIGRGEDIYTYINTVRNGTLDFTLLIDHPSILNKHRGTSSDIENKYEMEQDILRYFAGCGLLTNDINNEEKTYEHNEDEEPLIDIKPTTYTEKIAYVIFFSNNFSGIDFTREDIIPSLIVTLKDYNDNKTTSSLKITDRSYSADTNTSQRGIKPQNHEGTIRRYFFNGDDSIEIRYMDKIEKIYEEINGNTIFGHASKTCKIKNIEIKGFASSHENNELCNRRRNTMKEVLQHVSSELSDEKITFTEKEGEIVEMNDVNKPNVNYISAILARSAYAIFEIEYDEYSKPFNNPNDDIDNSGATVTGVIVDEVDDKKSDSGNQNEHTTVTVVEDDKYTYDNEYLYFSGLRSDSLVYKNIVDKVRFFDPGFHSITPEGFNARLTFLHQCTRQGPTNAVSSGNVNSGSTDYQKFAGNLAFGRAPYCILRIGDFFNTKICIDSISITYDNNGVQWDLNPEGVGVQPMYANVSITFKFIGGQDISGPVERLQNAVTANYYANASVYSRHADNKESYYDAIKDTNTILKDTNTNL